MTSVSQSLVVRNFLLAKHGHTAEECEDAISINTQRTRFALADGATEAFDAGNWARRIVSSWTKHNEILQPNEFCTWLESEGQQHSDAWAEIELSWYAREKERAGSFAAFVAVELELDANSRRWNGIAIGDSCLLQTRGDDLIEAFPVTKSADFGAAPVLAPSRLSLLSFAAKEVSVRSGAIEVGDELLVMSDATAAWFLRIFEEKDYETKKSFTRLLESENDAALAEFLERQRSNGRLKDDDIAIIRIKF